MWEKMASYYTIVFQWSHALQLLFVAAAIVCVLTPLRAERRALLIGLAQLAGVFVACVLSETVFFGLAGYARALGGMCFPLALLVVIAVYSVFFCRFYARMRVIVTCTLYAAMVTVTVYISQLTQLFTVPNDVTLEITAVAVNLLILLFAAFFVRFPISRFTDIPGGSAVLVSASSVTVVASVFINYVLMSSVLNDFAAHRVGMIYTFIAGVVMYIMMLVTYLLINIICQRNEQVLELQTQRKMAEADEKMLGITQKSIADLRLLRHDIKNRYSYMSLLIDNGQYDELKEYLQSMCDEIVPSFAVIDCGNRTVTNILNMEKAKAEARGIRMEAELNVPPVLPFKDTDLCSVFSNLIDNAIEACESADAENRDIRVRVSILQEYLYIGVMNPLPAGRSREEALELKTTKRDAASHGFGTKIVRRIAAFYNGYVTYSEQSGWFIAEVMLDMMQRREGGENDVSVCGM